ncbi:hypothetical protein B0J13DRAFT_639734 [Dactylonectria estremocensis]|uniref:Uncharacterized protein n=1 Tax=Dactylonectria estremocensis TaxID=1079267 RepID=A0A9P9EGD1_9HYPO|nr:hypothetical protein B0J13DRAFT_639734 [Dactylonectria estremocensis]
MSHRHETGPTVAGRADWVGNTPQHEAQVNPKPGSAEHLSTFVRGPKLGCSHFPKYRANKTANEQYPSRLGFFHGTNPDFQVSLLDTGRLCPECLLLVVPEGFNFWSMFERALGDNPPRPLQRPDGTPATWRDTSSTQTYPPLFQAGSEEFNQASPSAPGAAGGTFAPPMTLPMPQDLESEEAWSWLQHERKPFYIDQLHLAAGWNPAREKAAKSDATIVPRIGTRFVAEVPKAREKQVVNQDKSLADLLDHAVDSPVDTVSKFDLTSKDPKHQVGDSSSTGKTLTSPKTTDSVESAAAKQEQNNSAPGQVKKKPKSSYSRLVEGKVPSCHQTAETTVDTGGDVEEAKRKMSSAKTAKRTSPSGTSSLGKPVKKDATSENLRKEEVSVATIVTNLGTSSSPTNPPASSSVQPASARVLGVALANEAVELSILTDPQEAVSDKGNKSSREDAAGPTTHFKSKSLATHFSSWNPETVPADSLVSPPLIPDQSCRKPTAVSRIAQYTNNWCRAEPIPFDSSMKTPAIEDYMRQANISKQSSTSRANTPLEMLLKKEKILAKKKVDLLSDSDQSGSSILASLLEPKCEKARKDETKMADRAEIGSSEETKPMGISEDLAKMGNPIEMDLTDMSEDPAETENPVDMGPMARMEAMVVTLC